MSDQIALNGSDWLVKGFYGEDWRWRNAQKPGANDHTRGWLPGRVPGSVLYDLLQAGEIPNPYFERNSLLSEWACQRTWLYRKAFTVDPAFQGQRTRLAFDGVDYEAEFYLNGDLLGMHRGMFTSVVFEVGEKLKFGAENLLVVVIAASPQEQPQVGRSSRVRTHKARMNYWWDFCPRLVHQGIWDGVTLYASGPAVLEDVCVRPILSENFARATVRLDIRVTTLSAFQGELEASVRLGEATIITGRLSCVLPQGESTHTLELDLPQPRLWWPNGHGDQPLYTVEVSLRINQPGGAALSDQRQVPFGVRRIRFLPNQGGPPDALPYTLEVNGRLIYINGWNWVPIDALYGVERPHKLARLLALAQRANVNLLRVWGGGLIEKEAFYAVCDRAGILVWQEFIQSSSGIENDAPTDPDFMAMMVDEARQIVHRKRNHPSLAVWCGGNELSANDHPLDDSHPLLAALKSVVAELDPDRHWLPTSASGPVGYNDLENIARDLNRLHDVHGPWVYQGLEAQYTLYNRGASLYHSEFGVEGITNLATLNASIAPEHQWPVSLENPFWFHAGEWWVWAQKWSQIFGEPKDVASAVRLTQFLQFEGLRYAVEADRRRWPRNSGTSPWQFNEPFPMAACTSAVDYFASPKPAYYAVAGAYRPLTVSACYSTLAWGGRRRFEAEIWASQDGTLPTRQAVLGYRLVGFSGREALAGKQVVEIESNQSTRLMEIVTPLAPLEELFFLDLTLTERKKGLLAANRYLFSTGTDLSAVQDLPRAEIHVALEKGAAGSWRVTLNNPGQTTALYLWLESSRALAELDCAFFSHNYFCLLPGESAQVDVEWSAQAGEDRVLRLSGWNIEEQMIT